MSENTDIKWLGLYEYKSKVYRVAQLCKMKEPISKEWVRAVIYVYLNTSEVYVRELKDFKYNFKRLTPEDE